MFGFGRRKTVAARPAGPVIMDPLAVVPLVPPTVNVEQDDRGLLRLRQEIVVKGMRKRFAHWFGFDYTRTFELDDYGTQYFRLVDGKKTIREIVNEMMSKLGGRRADVERAVMLFTKQLMLKNMLVLHVTPESQAGRPS